MTQPMLVDTLASLRAQVEALPAVLKDIRDLFGLVPDGVQAQENAAPSVEEGFGP